MASYIARRKLLATLLGGAAAAWPLAARAQQPTMPVVGYLNFGSPESDTPRLTGLRRGLNQTGYVEGRNLVIEFAGRETKLTDCQSWRLIWSNFEWLWSSQPGYFLLLRLRLQPPASQSCSPLPPTPCSLGLLRASIGREAT